MSRLIVKGLPKYYNEDNLKKLFSRKGDVTDVKIMRKRDGESRRFGFIGYKSLEQAKNAVKYFNNSFIDTTRIEVSEAKSFSDPSVPLPVKVKRQLQLEKLQELEEKLKEEQTQKNKKQKLHTVDDEINSNRKLREYMEAVKPSHEVRSWANDEVADGSGGPLTSVLEAELERQDRENGSGKLVGSDGVNNNAFPSISNPDSSEKGKEKEKEIKDECKRDNAADTELDEQEKMIPLGEIEDDGLATNETVSDLDWLKLRRKRIRENAQEEESLSESAHSGISTKIQPAETENDTQTLPVSHKIGEESFSDQIMRTGRLFIRNILYSSTENDFRQLFEQYGSLDEVHIAIDTRTGKSKGFVYIQYKNSKDALDAYESLDKQIFQGRLLHILPAKEKKTHRLNEFDLQNLPLKKQRELKKKDQAAKSQFSWNSLYMNADAVLESVAAKMGISKAALRNPEDSSSAVKQALAEAHVISDVRSFFEQKGIDLTSFKKKEKDDRILLVKNFLYGTTFEELQDLFSQFGVLKRIIIPPAGTIAIVEFRDAPQARAAFAKLSYKNFKKGILYLEKGPKDLFTADAPHLDATEEESKGEIKKPVEVKVTAQELLGEENSIEEAVEGPTVSVFVKNLNFSTTTERLKEAFSLLQGFVTAVIKTKPDTKKPGSSLSMGFGFLEFRNLENANVAITVMDGYVLDGHKLQLKISNRKLVSSSSSSVRRNKSNKLIIKNLPFEASRKDVLELFGSFGQIKSVRVPKKFDRSARGFAFVEFVTLKEAENAMNQLEGVHLLGRRLVMQYAENMSEDSEAQIEKMTKKVQQQVATREMAAARLAGKGKRINLEQDNDDELTF